MGNEFEQQCFRRRPWQGIMCGGERPGLQVSQVRGQRPECVVAHAFVDQMPQRLNILVGQQLRQLVTPRDRQHGGDRIKFESTAIDRISSGAFHVIDDAGWSFRSVCPKPCPLNKSGALAIVAMA
ncbi:hypothetical protein D3C72_2161750 [compost metagenome]